MSDSKRTKPPTDLAAATAEVARRERILDDAKATEAQARIARGQTLLTNDAAAIKRADAEVSEATAAVARSQDALKAAQDAHSALLQQLKDDGARERAGSIGAALKTLQHAGKSFDEAIEQVAQAGAAVIAAEKAVIDAGADSSLSQQIHTANMWVIGILAHRLPFPGFKRLPLANQPTSFAAFLPAAFE